MMNTLVTTKIGQNKARYEMRTNRIPSLDVMRKIQMSTIAPKIAFLSLILSLVGIQGCGKGDLGTTADSEKVSAVSEEEFLIKSVYGESGVFLNDLLKELVKGNREILIESLAEEYLADIDPNIFLLELSIHGWRLTDYGFLSSTTFEGVHCFVMKFSGEHILGEEVNRWITTTPVYVINRDGDWKLWNFAFAPGTARNYPDAMLCIIRPKNEQ